jgi:rare lipoprotein A
VRWFILVLLVGCGGTAPRATTTSKATGGEAGVQYGLATWYGKEQQGGPTASGERFDMHAMTAAHRTLKLGTHVRVTNRKNGKSVEVRINDRGPYGSARRIIDLSMAAARVLDMIDAGVVPVRVEVIH